MLRRTLLLIAVMLALYVTASIGIGWLARQQLQQQINASAATDWLQQRWQAGVFNTQVELVTRESAPLAMQFHGQLQHGPLLQQPWQPGLLRLRGALVLPTDEPSAAAVVSAAQQNQRKDLTIDLYSSLRGQLNAQLRLPQQLHLRNPQPSTSGALHGLLQAKLHAASLQVMLQHPAGLLCLPDRSLGWQALQSELLLADHNNWLQHGNWSLRAATIDLQRAADCTDATDSGALPLAASSLDQLHIELRWPASLAAPLAAPITVTDADQTAEAIAAGTPRFSLQAAGWRSGEASIGPLSIELELQQLQRTVLADWLPLAIKLQTQTTPALTLEQLNLAALTAALLQPRPRLLLKQLQIDSTAGQTVLTGDITLRPGGVQANLHGETNAAAAQMLLSVVLQDAAAASELLQQWQQLGLIQDIDGRWLMDIVVNR